MNRSPFLQTYSWPLRLWHWLTFLIVSFLLLTVVAAEFVLGEESSGETVTNSLHKSGVTVNMQQANSVGEALREEVWEWHTIAGYVLIGLFVCRIILEFFQLPQQRFIRKMKTAIRHRNEPLRKQYLFAKITYIFFYLLVIGISSTGVWLAFHEDQKPLVIMQR